MRERRLPSSVEVKLFRNLKAMFFHEGSISIVSIASNNNSVRLKTFKISDDVVLFLKSKFWMSYRIQGWWVLGRRSQYYGLVYTMNVKAQLPQLGVHLFDLCLDRFQDIRSV